ncbi:MAG: hypothetical protein QNJ18_04465 [Xenococcaceae cyanobacterium MO_167.B52]|nr:hypothetical protein [Xenococcaceae cyanobacterium MO_167.B52]
MVLKTVESSLCRNTGAVGILIINGTPKAFGDITKPGSTIQAEAKPGDKTILDFGLPILD